MLAHQQQILDNPQATNWHGHEQITYRIPLWILRTKHTSQTISQNPKDGTNYDQWDIDIPSLAHCDVDIAMLR
jgi:hypothetical protein